VVPGGDLHRMLLRPSATPDRKWDDQRRTNRRPRNHSENPNYASRGARNYDYIVRLRGVSSQRSP
jgi:hypothetical protein